jgi:hypothetical protein
LKIQHLRKQAKELVRDSVERQQDFRDQLETHYHYQHNLARYDKVGLIDTMEQLNKLAH